MLIFHASCPNSPIPGSTRRARPFLHRPWVPARRAQPIRCPALHGGGGEASDNWSGLLGIAARVVERALGTVHGWNRGTPRRGDCRRARGVAAEPDAGGEVRPRGAAHRRVRGGSDRAGLGEGWQRSRPRGLSACANAATGSRGAGMIVAIGIRVPEAGGTETHRARATIGDAGAGQPGEADA